MLGRQMHMRMCIIIYMVENNSILMQQNIFISYLHTKHVVKCYYKHEESYQTQEGQECCLPCLHALGLVFWWSGWFYIIFIITKYNTVYITWQQGSCGLKHGLKTTSGYTLITHVTLHVATTIVASMNNPRTKLFLQIALGSKATTELIANASCPIFTTSEEQRYKNVGRSMPTLFVDTGSLLLDRKYSEKGFCVMNSWNGMCMVALVYPSTASPISSITPTPTAGDCLKDKESD